MSAKSRSESGFPFWKLFCLSVFCTKAFRFSERFCLRTSGIMSMYSRSEFVDGPISIRSFLDFETMPFFFLYARKVNGPMNGRAYATVPSCHKVCLSVLINLRGLKMETLPPKSRPSSIPKFAMLLKLNMVDATFFEGNIETMSITSRASDTLELAERPAMAANSK